MHIQLFTLRFSNTLGGFDTTALEAFVRRRDLIGFREHFFLVHEVPHLVCIVTWQDDAAPAPEPENHSELEARPGTMDANNGGAPRPPHGVRTSRAQRDSAPDPTAQLDEPARRLFNDLRAWRLTRSKADGVPPYIVFTNRQLLEVVTRRPDSANGLTQIHGVGPGKVKSYGREVLELVRAHTADPEDAPAPPIEEAAADPAEASAPSEAVSP